MIRVVLIVVIVFSIFLMLRHVNRSDAKQRRQFYKKLMWGGLIGFVIYLAATGRLHFIAAIVAGILPFAKKLVPLIRYVPLLRRLYKQVSSGSRLKSSLLAMTFDLQSGELDARVLEGPYKDKKLSQLSMDELLHIHRVASDSYQDSVSMLEAYLDRKFGPEWRQKSHTESTGKASSVSGDMSLDDAYSILGLESSASEEEVVQAHRKLMQKIHPDRGGSDFLAAQVNRAKEVILSKLRG